MNFGKWKVGIGGMLLACVCGEASAVIMDFETFPELETGTSYFSDAGPAQTISVDGVTIEGGVVLGFPSYLPAIDYATSPNLYGTANHPTGGAVGDASLLSTFSISIDSSLEALTVEGLLFNGLIGEDSFQISAYSLGALVDSVELTLDANLDSGFDVFSLSSDSGYIDFVTIAADLGGAYAGEWDFFVDSLAIGEPISNVLLPVPEPSSLALFTLGLLGIGYRRFK